MDLNVEEVLTNKVKTLIGEYILTILRLQTENKVLIEKLNNYQTLLNNKES